MERFINVLFQVRLEGHNSAATVAGQDIVSRKRGKFLRSKLNDSRLQKRENKLADQIRILLSLIHI